MLLRARNRQDVIKKSMWTFRDVLNKLDVSTHCVPVIERMGQSMFFCVHVELEYHMEGNRCHVLEWKN